VSPFRAGWQGMNWIRQSTRHAIYHRDGFACVYCGRSEFVDQVKLSLDHVLARELGGSDRSDNLVTCCAGEGGCNESKATSSLRDWLKKLRNERGTDTRKLGAKIRRHLRRPLDRAAGRVLAVQRKAERRGEVLNPDLPF
jgi:5-methylcytosine-specific restriction endonuclease McrA